METWYRKKMCHLCEKYTHMKIFPISEFQHDFLELKTTKPNELLGALNSLDNEKV